MPRDRHHDDDELRSIDVDRKRADRSKGRDIGPLPGVREPERRKRCELNLEAFCETYHPAVFSLGWALFHHTILDKLQSAILDGGLSAMALPRGSGKNEPSL